MPTKIDYIAIYTPHLEILEDADLSAEKKVDMITSIMKKTIEKAEDR